MTKFNNSPNSQTQQANKNPDEKRVEKIRDALRRQREASKVLDDAMDALHFLSRTLKMASMDDDTRLDYPEINGLGHILDILKDKLLDCAYGPMPTFFQLEELFGVKLKGGANENR